MVEREVHEEILGKRRAQGLERQLGVKNTIPYFIKHLFHEFPETTSKYTYLTCLIFIHTTVFSFMFVPNRVV